MSGSEAATMDKAQSTNNSLWLTLEGLVGSGDAASAEKAFQDNRDKLRLLLDHASFQAPSTQGAQALSAQLKSDFQAKERRIQRVQDFVKRISKRLNLDEMVSYQLLKAYTWQLLRDDAVFKLVFNDTELDNVTRFYYEERRDLLKSLLSLFLQKDTYAKQVQELTSDPEFLSRLTGQYRKLYGAECPEYGADKQLANERQAEEWTVQWLQQQALLLECLLVYFYNVKPASLDDFKRMLALFRDTKFGTPSTNVRFLRPHMHTMVERIQHLQVLILINCMALQEAVGMADPADAAAKADAIGETVYGPTGRLDKGVPAAVRLCARTLQLFAYVGRELDDDWRMQFLDGFADVAQFMAALLERTDFLSPYGVVFRLVLREPLLLMMRVIEMYFDVTDFSVLHILAAKIYGGDAALCDTFWAVDCQLVSVQRCILRYFGEYGDTGALALDELARSDTSAATVVPYMAVLKSLVSDGVPETANKVFMILQCPVLGHFDTRVWGAEPPSLGLWMFVRLVELRHMLRATTRGAAGNGGDGQQYGPMAECTALLELLHTIMLANTDLVNSLETYVADCLRACPQLRRHVVVAGGVENPSMPLLGAVSDIMDTCLKAATSLLAADHQWTALLTATLRCLMPYARANGDTAVVWSHIVKAGLMPTNQTSRDSGSYSRASIRDVCHKIEKVTGQYDASIAFLELVDSLVVQSQRVDARQEHVAWHSQLQAALAYLLHDVYVGMASWRYKSLLQRYQIGARMLELLCHVLEDVPIGRAPEKESPSAKSLLLDAFLFTPRASTVHSTLLSSVFFAQEQLRRMYATGKTVESGELEKMCILTLKLVSELLSVALTVPETEPVPLLIKNMLSYTHGDGDEPFIKVVADYIEHRSQSDAGAVAVHAVRVLTQLCELGSRSDAPTVSMAIYFDTNDKHLRNRFVDKLRRKSTDTELRLALFGFLSVVMETQPGLAYLFLDVQPKKAKPGAAKEAAFNNSSAEDVVFGANSCVHVVLQTLQDHTSVAPAILHGTLWLLYVMWQTKADYRHVEILRAWEGGRLWDLIGAMFDETRLQLLHGPFPLEDVDKAARVCLYSETLSFALQTVALEVYSAIQQANIQARLQKRDSKQGENNGNVENALGDKLKTLLKKLLSATLVQAIHKLQRLPSGDKGGPPDDATMGDSGDWLPKSFSLSSFLRPNISYPFGRQPGDNFMLDADALERKLGLPEANDERKAAYVRAVRLANVKMAAMDCQTNYLRSYTALLSCSRPLLRFQSSLPSAPGAMAVAYEQDLLESDQGLPATLEKLGGPSRRPAREDYPPELLELAEMLADADEMYATALRGELSRMLLLLTQHWMRSGPKADRLRGVLSRLVDGTESRGTGPFTALAKTATAGSMSRTRQSLLTTVLYLAENLAATASPDHQFSTAFTATLLRTLEVAVVLVYAYLVLTPEALRDADCAADSDAEGSGAMDTGASEPSGSGTDPERARELHTFTSALLLIETVLRLLPDPTQAVALLARSSIYAAAPVFVTEGPVYGAVLTPLIEHVSALIAAGRGANVAQASLALFVTMSHAGAGAEALHANDVARRLANSFAAHAQAEVERHELAQARDTQMDAGMAPGLFQAAVQQRDFDPPMAFYKKDKRHNPWHVVWCRSLSLVACLVRALKMRFVADAMGFVAIHFDRLMRIMYPGDVLTRAESREAEVVTALFAALASVGTWTFKTNPHARVWAQMLGDRLDLVPQAILNLCERYVVLMDDACSSASTVLVNPVSRDERNLNAAKTRVRLLSAKAPQRRENADETEGTLLLRETEMSMHTVLRHCVAFLRAVTPPTVLPTYAYEYEHSKYQLLREGKDIVHVQRLLSYCKLCCQFVQRLKGGAMSKQDIESVSGGGSGMGATLDTARETVLTALDAAVYVVICQEGLAWCSDMDVHVKRELHQSITSDLGDILNALDKDGQTSSASPGQTPSGRRASSAWSPVSPALRRQTMTGLKALMSRSLSVDPSLGSADEQTQFLHALIESRAGDSEW